MKLSEMFYSVQGEGQTMGVPAVFVRLAGCNLHCGIDDATLQMVAKDNFQQTMIEKYKLPDAKWVCDTLAVWTKGVETSSKELYDDMVVKGFTTHIGHGAHVVWTGGEPLLHQQEIIDFVQFLAARQLYTIEEVETNGTIQPTPEFDRCMTRYNISLKLSNSGLPLERRIKPDVIKWFVENNQFAIPDKGITFKFVVIDQQDVDEVLDICHTYDIPDRKVILMPGASTRQELIDNSKMVVELCKKHNFRYSSRLQLEIWDKKTGV